MGLGGALKRSADRLVKQGSDIPDAHAFYRAMLPLTTIKLFFVEDVENDATLPNSLPVVPGTMRLHQLVTLQPGSFIYRDVSCFCYLPGIVPCKCFSPKSFEFPQVAQCAEAAGPTEPEIVTNAETSKQINEPSSYADAAAGLTDEVTQLLNKWVLVNYDGVVYPGIVQSVEETDVEVKCMSRIGKNRYFWPQIEDKIWYIHDDILSTIPQPEKVGSRHVKLAENIWQLYCT